MARLFHFCPDENIFNIQTQVYFLCNNLQQLSLSRVAYGFGSLLFNCLNCAVDDFIIIDLEFLLRGSNRAYVQRKRVYMLLF